MNNEVHEGQKGQDDADSGRRRDAKYHEQCKDEQSSGEPLAIGRRGAPLFVSSAGVGRVPRSFRQSAPKQRPELAKRSHNRPEHRQVDQFEPTIEIVGRTALLAWIVSVHD